MIKSKKNCIEVFPGKDAVFRDQDHGCVRNVKQKAFRHNQTGHNGELEVLFTQKKVPAGPGREIS